MYDRMLVVCRLWPSISPWNIWDLRYDVWTRLFMPAVDDYLEQKRRQARG